MHRSANDVPACFAAIGTRLCPVMPGDVLTSRNEYVPSARRIRSSRPQPLQPTTSNAASAWARISSSLACGNPLGQKYFVSSEKYLLW